MNIIIYTAANMEKKNHCNARDDSEEEDHDHYDKSDEDANDLG
jgi:hypothetical protein